MVGDVTLKAEMTISFAWRPSLVGGQTKSKFGGREDKSGTPLPMDILHMAAQVLC